MPLPNGRLFHPQFEAHHRAVADRQMTAECTITDVQFAEVYSGPCRVRSGGAGTFLPVTSDQRIADAPCTVTIPATAEGVRPGHVVELTACASYPDLVGQQLVVRAILPGSITWQRDLACDMPSQPAL